MKELHATFYLRTFQKKNSFFPHTLVNIGEEVRLVFKQYSKIEIFSWQNFARQVSKHNSYRKIVFAVT